MAQVHLYMGVQRLTATVPQWGLLIAAMQSKGQANSGSDPSLRNHWRPSLDNNTWIFEAQFESSNIDETWFVNWLAGLFSVDPGDISVATSSNQYGTFLTFTYDAIDRIRIGVFGMVQGQGWPTWADSQVQARQYIQDNIADWEIPDP